jgi:hypothetical protein
MKAAIALLVLSVVPAIPAAAESITEQLIKAQQQIIKLTQENAGLREQLASPARCEPKFWRYSVVVISPSTGEYSYTGEPSSTEEQAKASALAVCHRDFRRHFPHGAGNEDWFCGRATLRRLN